MPSEQFSAVSDNDGDVSYISENKQHEIMMVMSAISARTSTMRY
jgi:hypothetical protein